MTMIRLIAPILTLTVMASNAPALAQYAPVDPMPMGHTATSVMGNKISGDIASGKTQSNTQSSRCFANSGPGAERRAQEAAYARRLKVDGKVKADEWLKQEGQAYRAGLVAQGKCK